MKYLIYSREENTYYSNDSNNHWVKEIKKAIKFTSIEAAKNTISNQLSTVPNASQLEITTISGQDANAPDLDDPEETFKDFKETMDLFADYAKHIDQMISYYSKQLSHYDSMQEDILHKVEFDNVIGIAAVRLIKQLKEIRIARREVKDKLALLQGMSTSKIGSLKSNLNKFYNVQENRHYSPRVLTELFG